jgi:NodT family efflux transporter outer membrane factor (OMF) lipoprotein
MSAQRRRLSVFRTGTVCGALALGGCAVSPSHHVPPEMPADGYRSVPLPESLAAGADDEDQHFHIGAAVQERWWTLLGSRQLDALIENALSANPGLDGAKAALRVAQETAAAQRGAFYPTLDAQYSPSRTKIAGNQGSSAPGVQGDGSNLTAFQGTPASEGGSAPYNAPLTYTYHHAQLTVGFVPDVFGINHMQVGALDADTQAQRLELQAARTTLAANITAASIEDALLRRQLMLAERLRDAAAAQRDLSRHQQEKGYLSRAGVAPLELAAAQSEAGLPPLRRQLAQNQNLLRVLCGFASDHPMPAFDLDEFTVPRNLPVSIPSVLVARRPDVLAAAQGLTAADLRAGIAHRARLPQLSISAAVGGTAARFDQMFWSSGSFFNVTGNLLQPLFRGGTLLHQERAARAAVDVAEAQYRATVLAAFQNVADALQALLSDADGLKSGDLALQAARSTADFAHRQLARGEIDRLTALAAEQIRDQAEMNVAQLHAARLADTTALYVALGGGVSVATASVPAVPLRTISPTP